MSLPRPKVSRPLGALLLRCGRSARAPSEFTDTGRAPLCRPIMQTRGWLQGRLACHLATVPLSLSLRLTSRSVCLGGKEQPNGCCQVSVVWQRRKRVGGKSAICAPKSRRSLIGHKLAHQTSGQAAPIGPKRKWRPCLLAIWMQRQVLARAKWAPQRNVTMRWGAN